MNSPMRAFTLIELLIVVAIIAILAAIAVPNFLEAQTRSKVSRVKADQRSVATALEAYAVDHNHYPPQWQMGTQTLTIRADESLVRLTTPVAFVTSLEALRDPFIQNADAAVGPDLPGAGTRYEQDYMGYQCYETFLEDYTNISPPTYRNLKAWALWSNGPDKRDDAPAWRMYNHAMAPDVELWAEMLLDGTYDPTNGTISVGDIVRFGGETPGVAAEVSR